MDAPDLNSPRNPRWFAPLLFFAALGIAAIGARPWAGSWNDGSRLASVEALVDHGTWAIDRSIFVQVPAELVAAGRSPYNPDESLLLKHGTRDKLLIDGHYYTDKPPVASAMMAGIYQIWRWGGGPSFAERPDLVCWFLTVATSGMAYAVAVLCLYLLSHRLGLRRELGLLVTCGLALSSVALPYTQHVNNHILLLGVSSTLVLQVLRLREEVEERGPSWKRLLSVGALAGFGYTLDLGLGPILLPSLLTLVSYRTRSIRCVAICFVGVLPWVGAHHAINFAIGGTFGPANAVPEYLNWPGSPFSQTNMTGMLRHDPGKFAVYSLALLFGKHGFLLHNLPLLLALPATVVLLRKPSVLRPELLFALTWCAGGWLAYAAFSNNYGGACCSVRWFVPLLAPALFVVASFLRQRPEYRVPFAILCAWGAVLGAIMWSIGPFPRKMVPLYWPIVAAALTTCGFWWRYRRARSELGGAEIQSARILLPAPPRTVSACNPGVHAPD